MHMKHSDEAHGPPVVPVKFVLEDPEGLTSTEQVEWDLMGGEGENLLELAVENGENGGSSQLSVRACIERPDANGRVGDAGVELRPGRRTGSLYSVTATESYPAARTSAYASSLRDSRAGRCHGRPRTASRRR